MPWERLEPSSSGVPGKKCSVTVFPAKTGWPTSTPGIDRAEGDAGAGRGARPVLELDLRPGPVRPDRAQPPLVREPGLGTVGILDGPAPGFVLVHLDAAEFGRLDAGGLDDRRRRGEFGSSVRVDRKCTTAAAASRRRDEGEESDGAEEGAAMPGADSHVRHRVPGRFQLRQYLTAYKALAWGERIPVPGSRGPNPSLVRGQEAV